MINPASAIILRDVPKVSAQIDLLSYPLKGGFRGFCQVPPGVHHVSVLANETHPGFWCYLQPNEVLVKVFNHTQQQFVDDELESAANYQALAISGAMGTALLPYPQEQWENWWSLTRHISASGFPPQLHQEIANEAPVGLSAAALAEWMQQHHKSRFELALFDTHGGDTAAFMAELQFAFVRWLVNFKDHEDTEAFNRWRHLLVSIYNVGESTIAQTPHLFLDLIDSLLAQFNQLPDNLFAPNSFIRQSADNLAEDMIDTEIAELVEKGEEFAAYMEKRRFNQ